MKVDTVNLQGSISELERGAGVQLNKDKKYEDEELKKACQEFEAFFWHQLLRAMRKTIPRGGFLEQERSFERVLYEDLLDEQYAQILAQRHTAGIWKILYEQLHQEFKEVKK